MSNYINITRGNPLDNTRSAKLPQHSSSVSSSSSSSVRETEYISLEYDPVKKRKLLNTYEIIEDLGSGQHGKVKLALDTLTNEQVAIKILDREGKSKVGAVKKFIPKTLDSSSSSSFISHNSTNGSLLSENEIKIRKEIAIMKKCNHENIVKLKEVIDDHRLRKIYLVLEYLEKGEIKWQLVDNTNIDNENDPKNYYPALNFHQALRALKDVLLGVEYLHYQGIIHRDIKPSNLLISKDNIVKISDFGVSFSLLENEKYEEYDLCKSAGTPAFFAPELCSLNESNCGLVSHKVDVWAMGVTFYCFLFGKLPFNGKSGFDLFDKINNEEVKIPSFEEYKSYPTLKNDSVSIVDYNNSIDLLNKLLKKNPFERIDIPEIKQHELFELILQNDEDRFKFDYNLHLNYQELIADNEESNQEVNNQDLKMEISHDEEKNITNNDFSTKFKSGLSKVLNISGLSPHNDKSSISSPSPGISPQPQHHHHTLSVSSIFSKKNISSPSNSTSSSRKNTIETPNNLTHKNSSLSLHSGFSLNSDKTTENFQQPLFYHNNLTNSSFISPSINRSQEYFTQPSQNEDGNRTPSIFGGAFSQKSNSQLSLGSHSSLKNLSAKHSRGISNGSIEINESLEFEKKFVNSPINSPGIKFGSKSRNDSFLNGYNNGISLPRKSSNISLPVNSSYASLNIIEDELLFTKLGKDDKPQITSSLSGFLNNIDNTIGNFKFDDSVKEKLYGRKSDNNSGLKEKVSSVSTINEIPNKPFPKVNSGFILHDSSSDEEESDNENIHFNVSNPVTKRRISRAGFLLGDGDTSSDNDEDIDIEGNELKLVDSVVTVPNSLISKLNSSTIEDDNFTADDLLSNNRNNGFQKNLHNDNNQHIRNFPVNFQLSNDADDDDDSIESKGAFGTFNNNNSMYNETTFNETIINPLPEIFNKDNKTKSK